MTYKPWDERLQQLAKKYGKEEAEKFDRTSRKWLREFLAGEDGAANLDIFRSDSDSDSDSEEGLDTQS